MRLRTHVIQLDAFTIKYEPKRMSRGFKVIMIILAGIALYWLLFGI